MKLGKELGKPPRELAQPIAEALARVEAIVSHIDPELCAGCGLCEEACPEEAIFMSKTYVVVGHSRELMVFDKEKLYVTVFEGDESDGLEQDKEAHKL